MQDFYMGILLISIISAIIFKVKGKGKFFKIAVVCAVVSFIAFGITGDHNKPVEKVEVKTVASITDIPQPTVVPTKTVGTITVDDIGMAIILLNPTNSKDIVFTDSRFIGTSKDGKSNLTLDGSKENITEISLNLNHLDKSSVTPDTGTSLVSSLIKGSVPEWTDVDAWLVSAYKSFSTTKEEYLYKEKKVGNKTVGLTYNVTESSLYLTITNK